MTDYVTLLGAEDVRNAASSMAQSAQQINQAATAIADALFHQRHFLDEWLTRLEAAMSGPQHGDTK